MSGHWLGSGNDSVSPRRSRNDRMPGPSGGELGRREDFHESSDRRVPDPIICAQDFPESYLFRTTRSGPSLAVVEAAWPPEQGAQAKANAAYRLKLAGGVWKIDGISCGAGDAYNWSPR